MTIDSSYLGGGDPQGKIVEKEAESAGAKRKRPSSDLIEHVKEAVIEKIRRSHSIAHREYCSYANSNRPLG